MKTAKVIGFYILDNFIHNSKDMKIRVSFKDRLKFLLFGESTVFRFSNEDVIKNTTANKFSIKNTPMKPKCIDEECGAFDCPACGHTIIALDDMTIHQNCLLCGQKLDWGCEI